MIGHDRTTACILGSALSAAAARQLPTVGTPAGAKRSAAHLCQPGRSSACTVAPYNHQLQPHAAASLPSLASPQTPALLAVKPLAPPGRTCTRIAHSKAAAAAAPVAATATDSWIKATGVPLLEVLRQMTIQQAAVRSATLIIATMVAVVVGNKLLAVVGEKLDALNEHSGNTTGLDLLVSTALASVHRPALVLLPWYGFSYVLLVISAFADVAVTRFDTKIHAVSQLCAYHVLSFLRQTTQLMQDTSQLVVIVFTAWFLISWKRHLLSSILLKLESEAEESNIGRVLVPASNLLSWAIVAIAILCTLAAFGIDVQPLLTFGSISTVAVGFAAQSTMQNVVSALQIYSSRPFIVGDRVQLKTLGGSVLVSGIVEHIAPMRTVIRGGDKLPIYINNKDVMNLIVVNESKNRRDSVLPGQAISTTLTMRYQDMDQLPEIEKSITDFLRNHPDIDLNLGGPRCVLSELTTSGPQLSIKAVLHRRAVARQPLVLADLLRGAEQIARERGCFLAVEERLGRGLPPSPALQESGAADQVPANGGKVMSQ